MNNKIIIAAVFALGLSTANVHAGEAAEAGTANTEVGSQALLSLTATVTAVDLEKRQVTLANAEGEPFVITVSDAVKNLPQVAVGDQLDVSYYESVSFELLAPGEASADAAAVAVVDSAAEGEKPAASTTSELSFVATVEAIDKDAETVDLKGPEGNTKTVRVNDPANLEKVTVGDKLLITVTQSIAVEVSGAQTGG